MLWNSGFFEIVDSFPPTDESTTSRFHHTSIYIQCPKMNKEIFYLTNFFNLSEHLSIHGLWNDDEIFKLCWIFNNDYNDNNNNDNNNNNTKNRGHIGSRFDSRKQCSYIISSYHSYCIALLLSELKSGPWARACGQKQKLKKKSTNHVYQQQKKQASNWSHTFV